MKNEIILFEEQNIRLEVNMHEETVWLTSKQMSELFETTKRNIEMHIVNIYEEKELEENSTRKDFFQVQIEGNREVKRTQKIYNLDVIISVGYRVKSKNGIAFRKWANKVLKDYLIKGYAINNKRLEYLEKTVKLIDIASRIDSDLTTDSAKEIFKIINSYSNALNLLDSYDYKTITKPKGRVDSNKITYEDCLDIINKLKFNNNSNLFALERNKGLKSIIDSIYQSFDNKDLYPTIEEKGANFFYMVIKNHVFIDGNKRIAATLFIYFLNFYNILYKDNIKVIDNNTLTALTLLIAQSSPLEKEILIDLIINFISN